MAGLNNLSIIVLLCAVVFVRWATAAQISSSLNTGVCLCANEPNVVAIKTPGQSGSVVETLTTGQCFLSNGGIYHYNGNTWYELKDINGQIGWVDGFYLSVENMRMCDPSSTATIATNHLASDPASGCFVYGIQYTHGQKFSVHGLYCTCDDGSPLCSFTGHSCLEGGNVYPNGSRFNLATKGDCTCVQGKVQCSSGGSAVGR